MADAQTNLARIGYAIESAYGSTIPSAALKTLRFTEESIAHQKNASWSNEIDSAGNRVAVLDISKSAAGSFTSELSFTDFEAWLIAAIRAGVGTETDGVTKYTNANVLKSFYLEKQFTDISAFIGCYGLVISEFSLNLSANAIAMATFALMGKQLKKESATRGTGAITAPSRDQVMRCGADVASLTLGGSAFPCAVQNLTLNIQNNTRPKTEITVDSPTAHNLGTFDVSGSARCYFPSTSLFDDFLAHTAKALSFSLSNAAGRFGFNLPAITITGHSAPINGINQDVMAEINFLAARTDSAAYTLELEVEPAV